MRLSVIPSHPFPTTVISSAAEKSPTSYAAISMRQKQQKKNFAARIFINYFMNAIFTVIFIASTLAMLFIAPTELLPTLLSGAESSAKMALTLFCIYAVWMSLSRLAEKSGLSKTAAKALKPLSKKLFKTENDAALENLAMNLSCNLLGIGGAATPYAVKAIGELEKDNNGFAQKLLFVINATSIQILPTTVIALRATAGSANPYDIFLPSLICTFISTLLGATLFIATYKLNKPRTFPRRARRCKKAAK